MHISKTVFMFSGQGSHYFQMGQGLFNELPAFRSWMCRMDDIVRQQSNYSVIDTLYNDGHSKAEMFDRMLLTNPAIFMVEYALAQALIEAGVTPDIVLGTSMGSFAAAAIAGCIRVEDALKAVINQAIVCEKYCKKGGMIAILADPSIYQEDALRNNCTIASYNFSTHFVVAAKQDSFVHIETFLREKNVSFQRLSVSYAFHSSEMDVAKIPALSFFQSISFKPAVIPMACCTQSKIIESLPADYFWEVVREPIRFQQTIAYLETMGNYRYIDAGPAGTLATFLKYVLPSASRSKALAALTPYGRGLENFMAITAKSL